ncbi:hypothetical protein [Allohahella marinimesophila]|uniref:Lipocalin-like domain-containing protein n=1 Tax=Allohahella marinimesophila TaxID=1054972 RepID=A0ABP7PS81_9GAMM
MIGEWKGACTANPTPGGSSHYVDQYSFSESGVDFRVEYYEDPDCTVQLSAGDNSTLRGEYTLGSPVTTAEGLAAREINFVFSELDGEAIGLEYQDLVTVDGNTLYLGTESETGSRTDSLNLEEPLLRQ